MSTLYKITPDLLERLKAAAIIMVLSSLIISGCIESIDFRTDRFGYRLVVDGRITDDPGPHELYLGFASRDKTTTQPVEGATITIFDDHGNSENYVEDSEGTYLLYGDSVQGIRGRTYHIEVQLLNGRSYRSMPETLPMAAAQDSIYYKVTTVEEISKYGVVSEEDALEVYIDSSIPETDEPLYLRWSVEEVYKFTEYDYPDPFHAPPPFCYVYHYPNPQDITLFTTETSDATRIEGQLLATRKFDFSFYQRHYFNVIQTSLTQNAYEYWDQADQVINSTGTIFDVPPAVPKGNIYNVEDEHEQVLGYFEAAVYDTVRFFTLPHEAPNYIHDPCGPLIRNRPPYCYSCLDLPYSTRVEPFYWLND